MSWFTSLILPKSKERDIKFYTAIESSNQIQALFKMYREGDFDIDLSQMAFTKIYPHEEKSPAIFWIDQKQLIIRYPENSIPYFDTFLNKCKFVECLSGILFDKNSNKKLLPGDHLKVSPKDNFIPYTHDSPCYIRVFISDCSKTLNQIFK
jgi:hypothetical protein